MVETELKANVLDELSWDPRVDASGIAVSVDGQSITLSGIVPTYIEKLAITRAAKRVSDAKEIDNQVKVQLPTNFQRDDAQIAERIASVFEWNTSIPKDKVHFSVSNAHVTLTGEVDWEYQRRALEKLVEQISFIEGITNNVSLKPRAIAGNLKKQIENALKRSAMQEANKVKVSISGGIVTLEGTVKAPYERQLIEQAVWAAPGIQKVIDNISIGQNGT